MSDLISRKLAIELLENTIAMTKKEERRGNYCVELIKAMPSAVPTPHGRLIDADALIENANFYETEMETKEAPTVIEPEGI